MQKVTPDISIIIPVINEEEKIKVFFDNLKKTIDNDIVPVELIVVDGGSRDNTVHKIKEYSIKNNFKINLYSLSKSQGPCRAVQMNFGVKKANGNIFIFLHIDTILPNNIKVFSKIKKTILQGRNGGAFNIRFEPKNIRMRIVEFLDRLLISITGNFFGDQAIFISRDFFKKINGFPEIPIMEDLIISDFLKKSKNYIIFKDSVITSSRRFYKNGIFKQMFLNIYLFNYFRFGGSPKSIIKKYEKIE